MTVAGTVLLAALSIWDAPARQPRHEALRSALIAAVRQGDAAAMAEVSQKGVALLPEDPIWRYNVACAEAKLAHREAALESLEQAIKLGLYDPARIEQDADFKAYREDPEFKRLVELSERLQDNPPVDVPRLLVPAVAQVGGRLEIAEQNLSWDYDTGCFLAKVELQGPGDAGNAGDLYFNRDAGHSVLKLADFPGLTQVALDPEGHARGADVDLPNMVFPCPVFGNCSRALTTGPFWRSLPRLMMTTDAHHLGRQYKLYRANQIWVFPAVNDHPPLGTMGDLFASTTPYWIATQGRSWSDQYYLRAALEVSRSIPRDVKRAAVANGLLAPTIQAIIRRSLKGVQTEEDYLSPKAHPTAFPANGLDLGRLKTLSRRMKEQDLAPVAVIARMAGTGTAYQGKLREMTYVTPCAVGVVLRGEEPERSFIVQVAGGSDYAFAQVHGDPAAVKIEQLKPDVARLTLKRELIPPTNRVDVAVFAKSKTSRWGAPSILSFATVDMNPEAAYADPVLTGLPPKPVPPPKEKGGAPAQ